MPPKSQRQVAAAKVKAEEEEPEKSFPAIVLADTFETKFQPFTLEKPRCLLPLGNVPVIEYTLEFLANAGIDEVFLYSGAHSEQLEKYIESSRWKSSGSPFKKITFLRSTSTSIGDVMRDLDSKHLITNDFITVHGDVVSNFPIEEALAKHRARAEADRNAIMTMVLRESSVSHRSSPSSSKPVFFIDPTKDRCVHYEEIEVGNKNDTQSGKRLTLEPAVIEEFPEIDIRGDLVDTSIDICTPDVLGLWSDSFDYQTPRRQFLHGVLKDYELNGKTIHTHIIGEPYYAAKVHDLKTYDAISRDSIMRYTFPFCPDINLLPGNNYRWTRGNIYLEHGVVRSRSAVIGRRTIIGRGTTVAEGATIVNSVIGCRCRIGRNVVLDGVYVWDGTVIGADTTIKHSIIANGVSVGSRCLIEPGSLLSFGVRIADGITLHEGTKVTNAWKSDGSSLAPDSSIVGEGGEGYQFLGEDNEEDGGGEEDARNTLLYNMEDLSLSSESISTFASESSLEEERAHAESVGTVYSEDERDTFHNDVMSSVYDSLREGHSSDVMQLDFLGLRLAANASDHKMRTALVTAFTKWISTMIETEHVLVSDAVHKVFTKYKDIFDRVVYDHGTDRKPDQVDLLLVIQREMVSTAKGSSMLLFMAKELYELEVVEQEGIEQWWADEEAVATEEMKNVRVQTKPFIDWLATAESDDSEEESDEE